MRAVLIYNPVAGRQRANRKREVEQVCAVLHAGGYALEAVPTTAAGSAASQARAAVAAGATHLFACGGDGTVHEVLQGLMDERTPAAERAVLGIVPMGSANVVARHLGLSMQPEVAARQLLSFVPRTLPVGMLECGGLTRYFLAMAGAGPDGALVYGASRRGNGRFGRIAYYGRAARLFATRSFPAFALEYVERESGAVRTMRAVALMATRVDDLGGIFRGLGCSGQLHHAHLQLLAVRPPALLSLPLWFAMGWAGLGRWNPLVHATKAAELRCLPVAGRRVHVQADGDWVGEAPMRASVVKDGIRLLMPVDPAGC